MFDLFAPPAYENGEGGGGEIKLNVYHGAITHECYFCGDLSRDI